LDWEYPVRGGLEGNIHRPEDGANFLLLLRALRSALGPDRPITIAVSASPEMLDLLPLKDISDVVDYVNVMAYDFYGSWTPTTGHNANYFPSSKSENAGQTAVKKILDAKVPPAKVILGVPMYARTWSNVPAGSNNGLWQPFGGMSPGTWEAGVYDYKDVRRKLDAKELTEFFDDQAKTSYAYNANTREFVSFDSVATVLSKAQDVKAQKLGGMMVWEVTGDYQDEILNSIRKGLSI
jgi:chitinase